MLRPAESRERLLGTFIAALGVVYGDIGTSPIYAIRECFHGARAVAPTDANVLGVLSLVFWTLVSVVVIKYLTLIMRADNHGQGGIMALCALAMARGRNAMHAGGPLGAAVILGLFGAGLLVGDGVITPAISVLSAVEGLEVATGRPSRAVVPITIAILMALFLVQRRGTGRLGRIFGRVTLLWLAAITAAGLPAIVAEPRVLAAVSPVHAYELFAHHGWTAFSLLGSVVLVITGAEVLYADMGHSGRSAIRLSWLTVVMPALLASYFGQGALVMARGAEVAHHPFYELVPGPWLHPMIALATAATIVASQAMISGVSSLAYQAIQLGFWPRLTIVHTSGAREGQVYLPGVNLMLMVTCIALVAGFRESSALAAAYGIAVTGAMAITSVLFYVVARARWGWSRLVAGSVLAALLAVDLTFLAANAGKVLGGGFVPLVIGLGVFVIMTTWYRGYHELRAMTEQERLPEHMLLADLEVNPLPRVRGTAVFMTASPLGIPNLVLHHIKHNKALHERVVLLSVVTWRVPVVPRDEQVSITSLGHGFFRVIVHQGFCQSTRVPEVLCRCQHGAFHFDPETATYYLGHETLLVDGKSRMATWRKRLFAFLARNARSPASFFGLPPGRVVELGTQIQL